MPLYDYECTICGLLFESLEKFNVDEVECEKCCGTAIRQVSGKYHIRGFGRKWSAEKEIKDMDKKAGL